MTTKDVTSDPATVSPLDHHNRKLEADLAESTDSETRLSAALAIQRRRATQSEELFRLLVESVRDYAIFVLDPEGYVVTWNTGAERLKGYHAEEIIGRHFSIFYPEEDVRSGKCEYELEVAARDDRVEDEGWRVRKDGSRFWADVVISAVRDASGTLIGFSKVTRDLTERRRGEDERAARLAAEQANRAKDEFLAMLGHELRNPLAPIATALQLMKMRGDGRLTREQQVIERQVGYMMRLIDDLLDMSRIAQGKIELKKRRLDLREVIARAIEVASPLIEQRQHHFEVEAPSEPVELDGDEARLVQVITNLLVNAAKYTEPGGHITLAVGQEGDDLALSVSDDGMGLDPALIPKIFDLFVQGQRGIERARGGLGIGLTLVRSIVELHGGRVEARSEGVGHGATFTVHLPRALPRATEDARSQVRSHPSDHARRILLVDDNEDALVLLGDALAGAGHDVRTAPDPVSALEIARAFHPEVAILDIGLPVMDGYELAGKLREELGEDRVHVIAVTGYGAESDRARSAEAGFQAHFVKPVDLRRLNDAITSV